MVAQHYSNASKRQQAHNSFKQIMSALMNYDSDYGHLPPACARDAGGRAMSSWRFLIVPYIGSSGSRYRFDLAWDDPVNRGLAVVPCRPFCFASIDGPPETQCMTNVLAVSGPDTAFDRENPHAISDLDSDTILIVETNSSRTHWMQPGDLDLSEVSTDAGGCGSIGVSGSCRDGFFVGFADGEVWLLSSRTPLAILRKFLTSHRRESESREEVLTPYRL